MLICAKATLRARFTPADVMAQLMDRADRAEQRHVWITRLSRNEVMGYVRALEPRSHRRAPLYGIPFVIKDNIDLAGVPTTAGCPRYAYVPARSATVVQRLLEAGAIPLGKTNLDQFATGLVGTRSPYGACRNSFDGRYHLGRLEFGIGRGRRHGPRELLARNRHGRLRAGYRRRSITWSVSSPLSGA